MLVPSWYLYRGTYYTILPISLCRTEYSSNAYIYIIPCISSLRVRLGSRARRITSSLFFHCVCFIFYLMPSFVCFFLSFFSFIITFFVLYYCFVILLSNVFRLLVCLCCASRVQYDGMASRCLICLRVLHDGISLLCQSL